MSRTNIIRYKQKINTFSVNLTRIVLASTLCFSLFIPTFVHADSSTLTTTQFQDPSPQAYDEFGYTVSLSSDGMTAVVGAPDYSANPLSYNGIAYVFVNNGSSWNLVTTLVPSDNGSYDVFGASTSITPDGSQIVVGAIGKGKAYVFEAPTGGWSASPSVSQQTAEILGSDTGSMDEYGFAVSQSSDGSTVLVTGLHKVINGLAYAGQAYLFVRPVDGWNSIPSPINETKILVPQTPIQYENFGWSGVVSSDGSKIFIGAPYAGKVYEFDKPSDGWNNSTTIQNENYSIDSPGVTTDNFGLSLALSSDNSELVIGAPAESVGSNTVQGAIFVYNLNAGSYSLLSELTGEDGASYDELGFSISISQDGNTILAGAPNHAYVDPTTSNVLPFSGVAYLFNNASSSWSQSNEIYGSSPSQYSNFGWSVSMLDSANIFVGAPAFTLPPVANTSAKQIVAHVSSNAASSTSHASAYLIRKASATPPPVLSPTISSFTASAGVGGQVTINGTNLSNASSVSFNGHSTSTFVQNSATKIIVTVPASAQTGPIKIVTANGSVTSTTNFTLNPNPAPSITSLTVPSPVLTHNVTIKGTNLLNTSSVTLNGLLLTIVSKTAKAVVVTIPATAVTGYLVVTTPSGTATSNAVVSVPAPVISSLSVAKQHVGKTVTIHGTTFIGVNKVTLNGVNIASFTKTATAITFTVPAGSTTGYIVVTSPSGSATSSSKLTIY